MFFLIRKSVLFIFHFYFSYPIIQRHEHQQQDEKEEQEKQRTMKQKRLGLTRRNAPHRSLWRKITMVFCENRSNFSKRCSFFHPTNE